MTGIRPIVRRTERMTLRALEPSDLDEFVRVQVVSRALWAPWTPARQPDATDRETFQEELARTRTGASAGTHLRLAGLLHDGRLAALFSLNEIVRGVFQNAHAGWSVSADATGCGLGTEGVLALLDIAFAASPEGLGLHRVQANIMPENAASLRIAEKVGFRREGVAARYLRIAGRWEEHVMHAFTSEEYEGRVRPHL